jgi:hypothetical protein
MLEQLSLPIYVVTSTPMPMPHGIEVLLRAMKVVPHFVKVRPSSQRHLKQIEECFIIDAMTNDASKGLL